MMIPMVLGIGGLAAVMTNRKKSPMGYEVDEVTASQRRVVYEQALNNKDPVSLRKLAAAFRDQGCDIEANKLDSRAAMYELPPEVLHERREVFRKLMKSTDPVVIRNAADVFESQSCDGAAANLRRYAQGLEDAANLASEGMTDDDGT